MKIVCLSSSSYWISQKYAQQKKNRNKEPNKGPACGSKIANATKFIMAHES